MGNAQDKNTGLKTEEFEQRTRRLLSEETPKSERDIIRAWLASDEDADMKRDVLCRVMLEHFESDTTLDPKNWEEVFRTLGLDTDTEDMNPWGPTKK